MDFGIVHNVRMKGENRMYMNELFTEGADEVFNPKPKSREVRNYYHEEFVKLMKTVKPIMLIKKGEK